jgi:methyl-accepting chemotaxis protein
VVPAAQRGDSAAALRAVAGPLTGLDAAFADPLDRLFTQELSAAATEVAAAQRTADRNEQVMILVGVVAALLAVAVGLLVTRLITAPVRRMVGVLQRVGDGDLTHSAGIDSRDEIGVMAGALDRATRSLRTALGTWLTPRRAWTDPPAN